MSKPMKSGKQRRAEIHAARALRRARWLEASRYAMPRGKAVPVDAAWLAPDGSNGSPAFVARGFYEDVAFRCVDCGAEGIWTAARQKWWYETARGGVWTVARRCAPCRARERERKQGARRAQQAGLLAKLARLAERK